MFGKPFEVTFRYAQGIGEKILESNNSEFYEYEASSFYMIGDNPDADIKGGN